MRPRLSAVLPVLPALAITAAIIGMTADQSGDFDSVVTIFISFLTVMAILAVFSLGLNVQWGYTGVFNFGVAGFFLVGAYTTAVMTKSPTDSEFTKYIGGFGQQLDFIPGIAGDQWLIFLFGTAAAAAVCGILAFLVSIPMLRLREDYLAITTIGVAELLRRIVIEEGSLVNGTRGLGGIPHPFSDLVSAADYKYVYLAIALAVLVLTYLAIERGIRSPWGRVLRALREDELTTQASGKNVYAFKTQGFVLGAIIMGIGGSIYAYQTRAISPDTFTHFFGTFLIWTMLIVGGSGNNKGAILGAYVIWGFWQATDLIQGYHLPEAIDSRISYFRDLTLGVLIVLVLLLRPQGLLPEESRVSIWVERRVHRLRGHTSPTAPDVPAAPD